MERKSKSGHVISIRPSCIVLPILNERRRKFGEVPPYVEMSCSGGRGEAGYIIIRVEAVVDCRHLRSRMLRSIHRTDLERCSALLHFLLGMKLQVIS